MENILYKAPFGPKLYSVYTKLQPFMFSFNKMCLFKREFVQM